MEQLEAHSNENDADVMNNSLNRSLFNASLDSSALSNYSPSTNPRRRESKSRAEKKRRDRINSCFRRMQQLLADGASQGVSLLRSTDSPCVEKAEILEQMIKYVELLRHQKQESQEEKPLKAENGSDGEMVRNFMSGYKKGVQNIFILIDRICHDAERLTKGELIAKIKKNYIDTSSPMSEVTRPQQTRPALGDLSNRDSAHKLTPTKKASISSGYESSPLPPAKKRRVFRELVPQQPMYEPISPDPFVPQTKGRAEEEEDLSLWRPWHNA